MKILKSTFIGFVVLVLLGIVFYIVDLFIGNVFHTFVLLCIIPMYVGLCYVIGEVILEWKT